jgi:hypothetical protein
MMRMAQKSRRDVMLTSFEALHAQLLMLKTLRLIAVTRENRDIIIRVR